MTTPVNQEDCPVSFTDAQIDQLRDVLDAARYTDKDVCEALDLKNLHPISSHNRDVLLWATRGGTALDALIRLFVIGTSVDIDSARRAAAPMDVQTWVQAGLLVTDGDGLRASLLLIPFRDLRVAYDLPPRPGVGLLPNYVMGIGSSTLTLANATIRRPSRDTLDLGTGCGFQAFAAVRHSRRVAAVDLNPRAVRMAAFNARLNRLANVECLEGSFFEPVEGRQFDLVVSNPPFVISPEMRYIYRDSGMQGDTVTRSLLRQVPRYLAEGGFCQLLTNWAHYEGEPWQQHVATWFEGSGCDAWAMRSETLDAEAYAVYWIRHTEHDQAVPFAERLDRWVEYYRRERIEAVSAGVITLRRRSGANWFWADEAPEKMLDTAGESIARGFELRDFLERTRDPRQLLDECFRLAPDVRLQQSLAPTPEGWALESCELQLMRGLAHVGRLDAYVAELLGGCNGRQPLGQLLAAMAAEVGQDVESLVEPCLGVVRRLVEHGFLLPAGVKGDSDVRKQ